MKLQKPRLVADTQEVQAIFSTIENFITRRFKNLSFHMGMILNHKFNSKLRFSNEVTKYFARMWCEENIMEFNFNTILDRRLNDTIVHEFAHRICYEYGLPLKHNLEFSIICNVLIRDFCCKDKYFFRHYDIWEEEYIDKLNINMVLFDKFINSIKYETLDELVAKAKHYAWNIRRNANKQKEK